MQGVGSVMKMIGLPISHKENENRRALIPSDAAKVSHPECLLIERGYGDILGFTDDDYLNAGAKIGSRDEVLACPIICDPKIGDAEYLPSLRNQAIFGWIHVDLHHELADVIKAGRLSAYAWEMMYEGGRHVFWRNNEIAGEAAIAHAYLCHGVFPSATKVALLGRGNAARGALRSLYTMGAEVRQYDRHTESLLRDELQEYDVVVNAVLWDQMRDDHVIYRTDLKRMKRGSMIIDISCDRAGAIETSVPTSIDAPTYVVDGIVHYAVDHTPALFYKSTTDAISSVLPRYLDGLIAGGWCGNLSACIARDGIIVNETIKGFLEKDCHR